MNEQEPKPAAPAEPSAPSKHLPWWKVLIFILLVLIGVTLVCYPFAASLLNRFSQSNVIDGYLNEVEGETAQEVDEKISEAMEYNERLLESSAVMTDPFSLEAYQAVLDGYDEILDIDKTGIMGYLDIPSINVHLPIYHGTGSYALQHGVGHLQTTSLPIGGESTHSVLSAHSGLRNADMFDNLENVQIGDTFSITVLNQTIYYQVYSTEVILPEQTQSLSIQLSRDLVTLVTCTPYGINTHRLLVHGERIDDPTQPTDDVQQKLTTTETKHMTMRTKLILFAVCGVAAIVVFTLVLVVIIDKLGRKKKQNP